MVGGARVAGLMTALILAFICLLVLCITVVQLVNSWRIGAARFGEITGTQIGDRLAIVVNDEVKSIALIQSQVSSQGRITGSFDRQAASTLAALLRAGPLPHGLQIVAEHPISPRKSAEAYIIRASVLAVILIVLASAIFVLRPRIRSTTGLTLESSPEFRGGSSS